MASNLKAAKEAFVSNTTGSTLAIVLSTVLLPVCLPLLLLKRLKVRSYAWSAAAVCGGMVASVMVAPNLVEGGAVEKYLPAMALAVLACAEPGGSNSTELVASLRASTYLMTYVSILAVDFPSFPRSFCKAEEAGYGLMDLGAGSYVFASGVCSRWARRVGPDCDSFGRRLKKCAPLLAFGLIRTVTVKAADYQEHASEYGTHWNFYFTLCAIGLGSYFLGGWRERCAVLVVLAAYQAWLSTMGGQEYVQGPGRDSGLFYMNREGVLGLPGYFGVLVLSEFVGRVFVWSKTQPNVPMYLVACSWLALLSVENLLGTVVSRRSTNLPYVLWVTATNLTVLFALDKINWHPDVMPVVNSQGLTTFIAANLMTGAVNFATNTMEWGMVGAVALVGCYMVGVLVAAKVRMR